MMVDVTPECEKLFKEMKRVMDADLSGEPYSSAGISTYKFARLEHLMWDYNQLHGDRNLLWGWVYRIFRRSFNPPDQQVYLTVSDKKHEKEIASLNTTPRSRT